MCERGKKENFISESFEKKNQCLHRMCGLLREQDVDADEVRVLFMDSLHGSDIHCTIFYLVDLLVLFLLLKNILSMSLFGRKKNVLPKGKEKDPAAL